MTSEFNRFNNHIRIRKSGLKTKSGLALVPDSFGWNPDLVSGWFNRIFGRMVQIFRPAFPWLLPKTVSFILVCMHNKNRICSCWFCIR